MCTVPERVQPTLFSKVRMVAGKLFAFLKPVVSMVRYTWVQELLLGRLLGNNRLAQRLFRFTWLRLGWERLRQFAMKYKWYWGSFLILVFSLWLMRALKRTAAYLPTFLASFSQTFLDYSFKFGFVSLMMVLVMGFRLVNRLSVSKVHTLAFNTVARNDDTVLKLGYPVVRSDMMRITYRQQGGFTALVGPARPEDEPQPPESTGYATSGVATASSLATPAPEGLRARVQYSLETLRVRLERSRLGKRLVDSVLGLFGREPERVHMVFPVSGSKGQAIVSAEARNSREWAPWTWGSTVLRLVAVDYLEGGQAASPAQGRDEQLPEFSSYQILVGSEARYAQDILSDLRLPLQLYLLSPLGDELALQEEQEEALDDLAQKQEQQRIDSEDERRLLELQIEADPDCDLAKMMAAKRRNASSHRADMFDERRSHGAEHSDAAAGDSSEKQQDKPAVA